MSTKIYDIDPVMVDVPMPIVTPRLMLRPPQAGDGAAMSEAKKASWPELQKWMDWAEKPEEHTVEKDEILCRQKQAAFILREDIMLFGFEKASGKVIVSTGLHRMDWKGRVFDIGYWVRSDEAGKGYATETANALLRYAFKALNANRVYIGHAEGNIASQRVIEKLGFTKEGVTKKSSILNGDLVTSHHYGRYDLDGLPDLEMRWGN